MAYYRDKDGYLQANGFTQFPWIPVIVIISILFLIGIGVHDAWRDSDTRACMNWRHADVCKAQLQLQRAEDTAQIEDELSTPEGRARFDAEHPDIAEKINF
jgi:hypothetical protein